MQIVTIGGTGVVKVKLISIFLFQILKIDINKVSFLL